MKKQPCDGTQGCFIARMGGKRVVLSCDECSFVVGWMYTSSARERCTTFCFEMDVSFSKSVLPHPVFSQNGCRLPEIVNGTSIFRFWCVSASRYREAYIQITPKWMSASRNRELYTYPFASSCYKVDVSFLYSRAVHPDHPKMDVDFPNS